jgi:hypothetical protein
VDLVAGLSYSCQRVECLRVATRGGRCARYLINESVSRGSLGWKLGRLSDHSSSIFGVILRLLSKHRASAPGRGRWDGSKQMRLKGTRPQANVARVYYSRVVQGVITHNHTTFVRYIDWATICRAVGTVMNRPTSPRALSRYDTT